MTPPADDTGAGLFQWLAGTALTAFGFAYAAVRNVRKDIEARMDKQDAETKAEMTRLWATFETDRQMAGAFRERIAREMVTKADLDGVKSELLTAIRERKAVVRT